MNTFNKQILALSIPSIITNITTPLLGIVDVAVVGHMGSAVYIAAIAVGGSMFNMLYWLFAFLRMGTSGMTAQACGAGDGRASSLILYRALAVAMAIGAVILVMQSLLCESVLDFMGADTGTRLLASRYFMMCVCGAPAVLGTYALSGWFLGMQDSRSPMWISVAINVANIAISLLLVYVFGMGIEGVATGTFMAQWLGFLLGLLLCRRYCLLRMPVGEILDWQELKRFFSVNLDIFLRTVCLVAVTVWFTRAGSQQGTVVLAINTLLMQLFMLFSFFMDGFAFAGEALCGKFVGAGNRADLRRCIKCLFSWGAGLALLFTLLYGVGGEWFLRFLSSDVAVTEGAGSYFVWAMLIPVTGFVAFTWDGVYIGATDTRSMLLSMVLATGVYFALYAMLSPSYGNHALWLSFICYLLTRGAVQTVIGRRYFV
ncbi:MAG: MATE family efflux transporter [Muribaculaceae bacterium]|nr:MATE family efflux transporter [Muribaculaceae bacterium]